jgi:hypothetical protein
MFSAFAKWVLLAALASIAGPAMAASPKSCKSLWSRTGPLQETARELFRTDALPEDGTIGGFVLKTLSDARGQSFVPRTLAESNCYLDRVLPKSVREAVRAGASQAVLKSDDEPNERLESLNDSINEKLDAIFVSQGMHPGTGVAALLSQLQTDYGLKGYNHSDVTILERAAFSSGLYSMNHVLGWIWLSYIEHLHVKGFDASPFITDFRARDASRAPPSTLKAPECPGGVDYHWPTVSTPIRTFADSGDVDVHWAVCEGTGDLWVYHYQHGWKQVPQDEKTKFCSRSLSHQPSFDRTCQR